MTMPRSGEIHCPACNRDSLLLREPVYDGFKKIGEQLLCASCRHPFSSEDEVPFKNRPAVKVFSDADRPAAVHLFAEGEADRLCRHCAQYVVNPFMQWCGWHKREVQATDTCDQFEPKPPGKAPEKPPPPSRPVL